MILPTCSTRNFFVQDYFVKRSNWFNAFESFFISSLNHISQRRNSLSFKSYKNSFRTRFTRSLGIKRIKTRYNTGVHTFSWIIIKIVIVSTHDGDDDADAEGDRAFTLHISSLLPFSIKIFKLIIYRLSLTIIFTINSYFSKYFFFHFCNLSTNWKIFKFVASVWILELD